MICCRPVCQRWLRELDAISSWMKARTHTDECNLSRAPVRGCDMNAGNAALSDPVNPSPGLLHVDNFFGFVIARSFAVGSAACVTPDDRPSNFGFVIRRGLVVNG